MDGNRVVPASSKLAGEMAGAVSARDLRNSTAEVIATSDVAGGVVNILMRPS